MFLERDEGLNLGIGKGLFFFFGGKIYRSKLDNLILLVGYVGCILSYGFRVYYFVYF